MTSRATVTQDNDLHPEIRDGHLIAITNRRKGKSSMGTSLDDLQLRPSTSPLAAQATLHPAINSIN